MITDEVVIEKLNEIADGLFLSHPSTATQRRCVYGAQEIRRLIVSVRAKICDPMPLVPDGITKAMYDAAHDWSYNKYGKPIGNEAAAGCWKAMRAALEASGPKLRGDDKPVAWAAGLEANLKGWIYVKAWREGEFTTPLYRLAAAQKPDNEGE